MKKYFFVFFMIMIANTALFAQKSAKPKIQHSQKIATKPLPKPSAAPGERLVEITTDFGVMVAKLYNNFNGY